MGTKKATKGKARAAKKKKKCGWKPPSAEPHPNPREIKCVRITVSIEKDGKPVNGCKVTAQSGTYVLDDKDVDGTGHLCVRETTGKCHIHAWGPDVDGLRFKSRVVFADGFWRDETVKFVLLPCACREEA